LNPINQKNQTPKKGCKSLFLGILENARYKKCRIHVIFIADLAFFFQKKTFFGNCVLKMYKFFEKYPTFEILYYYTNIKAL